MKKIPDFCRLLCLGAAAAVALLCLSRSPCAAQRFNIYTNLLDYANLGTLNLGASFGVAKNWSLEAGARYNPFRFEGRERGTFYSKQQSYSLGVRYWPWHINSGWWMGSKLRYQEYSSGGLWKSTSEEGDRYGVGLYGGYSYMLLPHLNLEFGLGLWMGGGTYRSYSCPVCGLTEAVGSKMFVLPDDFMIAIAYIF